MKCNRCHFENIPGQNRCFKCGSILEAARVAVDVHPPRMSTWRRPGRALVRWVRRHVPVSEKGPAKAVHKGLDRLTSDELTGAVFSIIPGLAHLIKKRFREVRWLVLAWAVLLAAGLFLYGHTIGALLIGSAIAVHAWIALRFGLIQQITAFIDRLVTALVVVACLGILYWATPRVFFPGYTGGYTAMNIPAMRIHNGDYLLVGPAGSVEETLPRGTLVLIDPPEFRNNRLAMLNQRPSMIGQIIGLPGETVQIAEGAYIVDGERLDPARYPVPRWLQDRLETFIVRPGSYFVSSPYSIRGRGAARVASETVRSACVFEKGEIHGRAFMRWWPLRNRGFIE